MICPACNRQNRDDSSFCVSCGSALAHFSAEPVVQPPLMRGLEEPDPAHTGKRYAQAKNPFIATILSFVIPAAGQLYNQDFKKAAAIWVGYALCFILSSTVIGTVPAVLLSFVLWGWAIFDAYQVAKRDKTLW